MQYSCHFHLALFALLYILTSLHSSFSPTLPESNALPFEFVEPLREDIDVEVVVGSMVQLETQQGEKLFGVVKYIGDVPGPGRWAGVEMEEEVRGGNNGWIQVLLLCTMA